MKIFYSWQSWLPANSNRYFIQKTIEQAIERINADPAIEFEVALDRDTLGEEGAVEIADAILRKIKNCQIFVCDVTSVARVTHNGKENLVPNPNVLIELGYAVAIVGWGNIICVVNEAHGKVDDMPFDLKHRRLLSYSLETGEPKSKARADLEEKMYDSIISTANYKRPVQIPSKLGKIKELLSKSEYQIELVDILRDEQESLLKRIQTEEFYSTRSQLIQQLDNREHWSHVFPLYVNTCKEFLQLMSVTAAYGHSRYTEIVRKSLQRLVVSPDDSQKYVTWRFIPSFLLCYAIGILAVEKNDWLLLSATLLPGAVQDTGIMGTELSIPFLLALLKYFFDPYEEILIGADRKPLGAYAQQYLHPILIEHFASEHEFIQAFDIFEMLLSLVSLKQVNEIKFNLGRGRHIIFPVAEYPGEMDKTRDYREAFWSEGGKLGSEWGLIKSGLLGTSVSDIRVALSYRQKLFENWQQRGYQTYHANYLNAYTPRPTWGPTLA